MPGRDVLISAQAGVRHIAELDESLSRSLKVPQCELAVQVCLLIDYFVRQSLEHRIVVGEVFLGSEIGDVAVMLKHSLHNALSNAGPVRSRTARSRGRKVPGG